jgi:small subunit ribosomal protein S16
MLKIKLARFGKKKQPHYRIVINEARDKRDGKYVESIGQYAPTLIPKILIVDLEKYESWLKKGAQPTDTVLALVTRFQSGNPFPEKTGRLSRKAKAKLAAAKEAEANPVPADVPEAAATPEAEVTAEQASTPDTAPAEAEVPTAVEAPTEEPAAE